MACARAPLTNPVEHALPDDDALLKIVRADTGDTIRYPIVLTLAERADLVAFLDALTGVDRNSRTAHP